MEMNGVDALMNYVLSHLLKFGKLPILKIQQFSEEDDLTSGIQDGEEFYTSDRDYKMINPATIAGLKKMTQLLAIAALISELKKDNTTMMLRDVYYTLKHIFDSQDTCNEAIFNLGKLLKLKRHEMNLIPSSKGLFTGNFRFTFQHSEQMNPNDEGAWILADNETAPEGVLIDSRWISIPDPKLKIEWLDHQMPIAIIMVEKEAIFYRLQQAEITNSLPCIMMTSCGYPDIATKAMLSRLSQQFPDIPVLGLCDYNPHGIALLLSFEYYSSASATFENAPWKTHIRWLGLRSHHVQNMVDYDPDTIITLQPLTIRDKSLIISLLRRPFISALPYHIDELTIMAGKGIKCEIESLHMLGLRTLADFVRVAIQNQDFI